MNDKKLEVFQELNLRARTDRSTIRAAILAHLPPEWSHDQKREDEVKVNGVSAEEVIVLQRSAAGAIPGARVFLWGETNGYRISNIVPIEVNELGISLYNQVLRDLVEQVARPASKAGGFDMIVSDDLQTIEDWLDPEAARLLRVFSSAANKSTGASHPMDRNRWFDFIISVHGSGPRFDPEKLARWLIEVELWQEDTAHDLAGEYERSIDLLDRYDVKNQ